jgi:predicted acetyltransferase
MWDVRNITEAEDDLFRARISLAFGRDLDSDESARERYLAIFERERSFAAFDGDDIVGTVTAFSLGVTVPGGAEVPMGGTTVIGVKPTHRRRGVLRALMDRHLAEIAERGEPLAGLWSSEGTIYGRFGYGPATFRHVMEATTTALRFNPVSGP